MPSRASLQRQFSEEILSRIRSRSSGQPANRVGNAITGLSSTAHHRAIVLHTTPTGHRDAHDTDAQSKSVATRDNRYTTKRASRGRRSETTDPADSSSCSSSETIWQTSVGTSPSATTTRYSYGRVKVSSLSRSSFSESRQTQKHSSANVLNASQPIFQLEHRWQRCNFVFQWTLFLFFYLNNCIMYK